MAAKMRSLRVVGPAILAVLAFVFLPIVADATSGPIPGTNVYLFEVADAESSVTYGESASFPFGLVNSENRSVTVLVSASTADSPVLLNLSDPSLVLDPDESAQVRVNVTVLADGDRKVVDVNVTFEVMDGMTILGTDSRVVRVVASPSPRTVDVVLAFLTVGGVIVTGFIAILVFEKTRIPDMLILIALGLLLGPIALVVFGLSLVPGEFLTLVTPYFAALALMFILFDGGLNIRIVQVARQLRTATAHTILAFILTVMLVAIVTMLILGYPWQVGMLLGAILGGTSGAVVIELVRRMRVSSGTRMILTLEAVITDVLCVITAIALIELLRFPQSSVTSVLADLATAFVYALGTGGAVGIVWLFALRRMEGLPFSFMVTIAVLFILFAATEFIGGSGAMAAFVFGLVLGNHDEIAKRIRMIQPFKVDSRFKQFHSELTFVVRTFFFTFLGLVFTFNFGGAWDVRTPIPVLNILDNTFWLLLIGIVVVFLSIAGVRILMATVTSSIQRSPDADRRAMWSVMGRGLATAVLASLPFTLPSYTDPSDPSYVPFHATMAPFERQMTTIAFFIILITLIATTIGVATTERHAKRVRLSLGLPVSKVHREADEASSSGEAYADSDPAESHGLQE